MACFAFFCCCSRSLPPAKGRMSRVTGASGPAHLLSSAELKQQPGRERKSSKNFPFTGTPAQSREIHEAMGFLWVQSGYPIRQRCNS